MQIGVVFPQTGIGSDVGGVRAYGEAVEALRFRHMLAYDLWCTASSTGSPSGYPNPPQRPLIFTGDLPIIDKPLPRFLDDATAAKLLRAALLKRLAQACEDLDAAAVMALAGCDDDAAFAILDRTLDGGFSSSLTSGTGSPRDRARGCPAS
ncbi:MAG: hypothetical protein ACRD0U_18400 [Acidimicrobiales bacterium]